MGVSKQPYKVKNYFLLGPFDTKGNLIQNFVEIRWVVFENLWLVSKLVNGIFVIYIIIMSPIENLVIDLFIFLIKKLFYYSSHLTLVNSTVYIGDITHICY